MAYLRTLEDSRALHTAFCPGRRILIIGAGWIGLEVAAAARTAGSEVTIESLDLPLPRVLGPEVAAIFAELHRSHGIDLRLGATVKNFASADTGVTVVRLGDGWGMAWHGADDPVTHTATSTNSAAADPRYFELAGRALSAAGIVHLRWATGGLAVTAPNTHPFAEGGTHLPTTATSHRAAGSSRSSLRRPATDWWATPIANAISAS